MKEIIKPTKHLSTKCLILVIAVFRACQPEALADNQGGVGGSAAGGGAAAAPSMCIADHPDCREDVRRICVDGNINLNDNFAVLDCLQRDRWDYADLSDACHHHIWFYKKNLTQDEQFDAAAFEACKPVLDLLPDCKNQVRLILVKFWVGIGKGDLLLFRCALPLIHQLQTRGSEFMTFVFVFLMLVNHFSICKKF